MLKGSVAANTGANMNPGSASGGTLTITGGLTESGGVNNNFQLTNTNPDVINVVGHLGCVQRHPKHQLEWLWH